jgi:hypothetical protein
LLGKSLRNKKSANLLVLPPDDGGAKYSFSFIEKTIFACLRQMAEFLLLHDFESNFLAAPITLTLLLALASRIPERTPSELLPNQIPQSSLPSSLH